MKPGAPGAFLQANYFLSNYNLEQAGAVMVPTVRTHDVLDAVGDRGYRLVSALIGSVAQAVYTVGRRGRRRLRGGARLRRDLLHRGTRPGTARRGARC